MNENHDDYKRTASFYDIEMRCESRFKEAGECWHLCTPGQFTEIIFTNDEEFSFGMNLMGFCANIFRGVRIYSFELMSNHIHIIMSGSAKDCDDFFSLYKKRLKRFLLKINRNVDLSKFTAELIPVIDLDSLRNEIVYVNRNGYVIDNSVTPFSYLWGAGAFFFNIYLERLDIVRFNSLPVKKRREILGSREVEFSDEFMFLNLTYLKGKCVDFDDYLKHSYDEDVSTLHKGGFIIPSSYCRIKEAQAFFRNAHHYFISLSKNFEAYSAISDRLGDKTIISDAEMYSAVISVCISQFNVRQISSLNFDEKIILAKIMHNKYNATNKQLQRILKLDSNTIETLYPKAQ